MATTRTLPLIASCLAFAILAFAPGALAQESSPVDLDPESFTVMGTGAFTQTITITNPGDELNQPIQKVTFTAPAANGGAMVTLVYDATNSGGPEGWVAAKEGTALAFTLSEPGPTDLGIIAGESEDFTIAFSFTGNADATFDATVTPENTFPGVGPVATPAALTIQRLTPPTIMDVGTRDVDADGQIDALRLLFDRPVKDTSFEVAAWAATHASQPLQGFALGDGGVSDQVDDEILFLTFTEDPSIHTGIVPDLTYDPSAGALKGLNDLAVAAIGPADVVEKDGAPPVLLSTAANQGSSQVGITFSEAVKGSGTGGALVASDLEYIDTASGGASSISSVAHTPTGQQPQKATVTLNVPANGGDLGIGGGPDAIRPLPATRDLANNPASVASRALIDATAPQVSAVETVDADGDGRLDGLRIRFSEAIDDSTLVASQWQISSPSYEAKKTVLDTLGSVDDDVVVLLFDPVPVAGMGDTSVKPGLAYVGSASCDPAGPMDLSGNCLGGTVPATSDAAAPVALTATTQDLDGNGRIEAYRVLFSESIQGSTAATGSWTVQGHTVTSADTGCGAADQACMDITFTEAESGADTGALPDLGYAGGDLRDATGNDLVDIATGDVEEDDGAGPVIVRFLGDPSSPDADRLDVLFSEGVRGTGPAGKVLTADLVFTGLPAGVTATGSTHTPGAALVSLTMSRDLVAGDYDPAFSVKPDDGDIEDPAENQALSTDVGVEISFFDVTPPSAPGTVTSAEFLAAPAWSNKNTGTFSWIAATDDSEVLGYTTTLDGADPSEDPADATASLSRSITQGLGEGDHTFKVRAIDRANNAGPITTYNFRIDTQPPAAFTISSTSHALDACTADDDVVLTWTAATDATSGLATTPYTVSLGSTTKAATAALTATFTDVDDGTHVVKVVAVDKAGNKVEATYSVVVATSIPTVAVTGPSIAHGDFDIAWSAQGGCGALEFTVESRFGSTGTWQAFSSGAATSKTFTPASGDGTYQFRAKAKDAADNQGSFPATPQLSVVFDTTAPVKVEGVGATALFNSVRVTWSANTDDVAGYDVLRSTSADGTFTKLNTALITATSYEDLHTAPTTSSTYYYKVRAVDGADNEGAASDAVPVAVSPRPTQDQIADANKALQASLRVKRVGQDNVLTWSTEGIEPTVRGLQVWRSLSPFTLLETLVPGEDAFDDATLRDIEVSADATYLLTLYFVDDEAGGLVQTLAQAPGFQGLTASEIDARAVGNVPAEDDGFPWWGWLVIVMGVLLIVLVVLLVRRKDAGDAASWDEEYDDAGEEFAWDDDEGGDPHTIACPQCDHEFTVHGEKPIHTTCPNCDVRGVLR